MRRVSAIILTIVIAMLAAACGDDEVPQAAPGSSDASTAVGDPAPTAAPSGPSEEDLRALFEALASRHVPDLKAAVALTAPGSLAELYVKHQLNTAQADLDSGAANEPDALTEKAGAYISCADGKSGDDCTRWADVEAQGDKVATFTTDGKRLNGRLLAGGKKTFRAGSMAKVRLLTSYETIAGDLSIALDIQNVSSSAIAIESRTSYRSKDGRQSDTGSAGPTSLQPDSRATYIIVVRGGSLGGDLHLELFNEQGGAANGIADIPIR